MDQRIVRVEVVETIRYQESFTLAEIEELAGMTLAEKLQNPLWSGNEDHALADLVDDIRFGESEKIDEFYDRVERNGDVSDYRLEVNFVPIV